MCGIVGYIGSKNVTEILMDGLTRLEYRGYDSAGVAVLENGKINVVKAQGRLQALREKLEKHPLTGHVGIGHTRWATHGEPSDENSHPHLSQSEEIAVVHNGIIENYAPLRQRLANKGYHFISQTDTEVFAQLLEETLGSHNDILTAVRAALEKIEGSYGLGVLCSRFPDRIIAARKDSPLIVGLGEDGNYIASDIPAILPYTRRAKWRRCLPITSRFMTWTASAWKRKSMKSPGRWTRRSGADTRTSCSRKFTIRDAPCATPSARA